MGNFLENLLHGAAPASVTEYFLWLIVALFVAAAVLSKRGECNRLVANTPNLLTSIGILGTFTGIVIGLMGFDTNNIDESINGLLAGLKTAFITSLVGMFGSIAFKALSSTPLLTHREQATGTDVGQELLVAMQSQGKQLQALHAAIAGDEESSLAGQIKLFRSDARDQHDIFTRELWKRLTDFSEMLSKSATEQIINALKEVITDFNNNLTEQFGENFRELNAAVHRLVEWQENYREQLEQMSEQYQQGVAAITQTETSVARISEEAQNIPVAMGALQEVLQVTQHQIQELSQHLQAFAEVRDRAVEAVPELQRQVEAIVTGISNATQQLVTGINASAESLSATADKLGQMQQHLENALQMVAERTEENVNRQLELIDKAMTQEVERVMNEMGTALASIAEKFTEDYRKLVNEMNTIVQQRGDR